MEIDGGKGRICYGILYEFLGGTYEYLQWHIDVDAGILNTASASDDIQRKTIDIYPENPALLDVWRQTCPC
jgi:hypothetical protein